MKDPMLHTMSEEMMDIMIRDWIADNPETAEDLVIDFYSITFVEASGRWSATATDAHGNVYTLTAYDGNITLNS